MMISNLTKLVISFFLISTLFSISANAANFAITNNCPYTVWAAAAPGGGQQLNNGETWTIAAPPGTTGGRIWARTGCSVTGPNGLTCQTGDCGGLLRCEGYGQAPNTLAEYGLDQFDNLDFFDMSLVAGFNVPMQFVPVSNGCTNGPICSVDINAQCPSVLQAPGGCNNPCTVFNTDEYCCNSGSCGPTSYSEFFKGLCPDAYSYPQDDPTSTYTCQTGADYNVVFCP